jgi:Peptidase C39 family
MLDEKHQVRPLGSGLLALTLVFRIRGEPIDADQVRDRCGAIVGVRDMLRAAAELGLTAELCEPAWDKLSGVEFPAVAALRDGAFLTLVSADADGVVALDGADGRQTMDRADFERIWDGRLVLIAPLPATDGRRRPREPIIRDPVETEGSSQPADGEAQPADGGREKKPPTRKRAAIPRTGQAVLGKSITGSARWSCCSVSTESVPIRSRFATALARPRSALPKWCAAPGKWA